MSAVARDNEKPVTPVNPDSMSTLLLSKKSIDRMGKSVNEATGSAVSSFARRQMEKMGWKEGKGLGKNEDGMATHIKQKKKDDNAGLGVDKTSEFAVDNNLKGGAKTSITGGNDNWWHDAFASNLKSLNKKGKKRSKKEGKEGDSDAPPTMEELFAATGGARLGMRARADQPGKFARAERDVNSAGGNPVVKNESKSGDGDEDEEKEVVIEKEEKKKKKEKKSNKHQRVDDDDDDDDESKAAKKKRKKDKKRTEKDAP